MSSKTEYFILALVKIFAAIIRLLPVSVALWVGRMIGMFGYFFDHRHKFLAYANLKIAFARHKKTSEIKRILKKVFQSYGQNLIELLRLPITDPHKYIKVEGKQYVDEAVKEGKGVILLAMHSGSWELCNFMSHLLEHPYSVIVNPQKRYSKLDDLLNSYRKDAGAGLVMPGTGTRDFVKALRRNEIVGMVVDQGGKTGSLVKFFGRDSSMSVGAIKMALKLDVPVCFCVLIRDKGPNHRLVIKPPFEFERNGNKEEDIKHNLNKVVTVMEEYISQYPLEYMWFYKIWKYSKESTIVILSDKKPGHLKQSFTLGEHIKKALGERSINAATEVIEIEFKDKFKERMFAALSLATHKKLSQGRMRYLKWFLKRKSFLEVMSVKGDFVISCGSSVSGVNYFLSQDYQAKSIAIQKPGILDFERFNLIILPEHDRTRQAEAKKNVVFTQLAPNLITEKYLQKESHSLVEKFPELHKKFKTTIGILFGGDSKEYFLSMSFVEEFIRQIKKVVDQSDVRILITTSRRTSKEVELFLKEELSNYKPCPFLIISNEHNVPDAVGGILGLSDIVIVSSDSISMVSEAVNAGKATVVVEAEKRNFKKITKHETFIKNLQEREHVIVPKIDQLEKIINQIMSSELKTISVNDDAILFEAARKII